jgi:hypothetical protein
MDIEDYIGRASTTLPITAELLVEPKPRKKMMSSEMGTNRGHAGKGGDRKPRGRHTGGQKGSGDNNGARSSRRRRRKPSSKPQASTSTAN